MADRVLRMKNDANDQLRQGIAQIREDLDVNEDFPAEVDAAAERAVAEVVLPDLDLCHLPFVTIDPPGAMDLDQAMHLERDGQGFVVRYAIADVASFVEPDGPVDMEARRRGETLYGADGKVPLHPKVLSEGATSLLPDQVRPALVWTIALDEGGQLVSAKLERARVKSSARLDYETVQKRIDDGSASEVLTILKEVGQLRIEIEKERGGVNLPMPEQEIDVVGDRWALEFRTVLPVENWNAQISLLTGFAAADLMVDHQVGILRTLPEPQQRSVDRLRRTAKALGIDWDKDIDYAEFIRGLDPNVPAQSAMIVASTSLLRGAGYVWFDGEVPVQTEQAALAANYAHVTAPLRRLVDRFGLEVCVAICAGRPVPQWVLDALPDLPGLMQEAGRKANAYENAVVGLVEAYVLKDSVGRAFTGVVTEIDDEDRTKGTLVIREPAIEASIRGHADLPLGERVAATLVEADPVSRQVRFELSG